MTTLAKVLCLVGIVVASCLSCLGIFHIYENLRQPPEIELPEEIDVQPAIPFELAAWTSGNRVSWNIPDGLKRYPLPHQFLGDSRSVFLFAPTAGKYCVQAITVRGNQLSDIAQCTVVVGTPPPPVPPVPPVPPPPPGPTDPLAKALQVAYAAETDASKGTYKASLAALYRQSAAVAGMLSLTTWGSLFDAMASAATTLGVSGKVMGMQQVIQTELKTKLPTSRSAPLDTPGRTLAAATFHHVADSLEQVK